MCDRIRVHEFLSLVGWVMGRFHLADAARGDLQGEFA